MHRPFNNSLIDRGCGGFGNKVCKRFDVRHGSLFSGIGGFDLAAEWMGWENVFHCENNPFCQKILKHYWPNAISYGDITKTDFTIHRGQIDIVTGGFPCQPYSVAGKRKGKEDDRHLWPEMLRAIREIQPSWVVGENVPGLLNWKRGMVLDEIKADLEASGFEIFPPLVLPACGKNAPHRRDRLWVVAYSEGNTGRYDLRNEGYEPQTVSQERFNEPEFVTNTTQQRQQGQRWAKRQLRKKAFGTGKASWSDNDGGWPTESPIHRGNDGLSKELAKECLTGLGNAVIPQVVYEIFKAIESV